MLMGILGILMILTGLGILIHRRLWDVAMDSRGLSAKIAYGATFLYPIDDPYMRRTIFLDTFTKKEIEEFIKQGVFPLYLPLKSFAELYAPDVLPLIVDLENGVNLTEEEMKEVIKVFLKFDDYRKKVLKEDFEIFIFWKDPKINWRKKWKKYLRYKFKMFFRIMKF